MAKSIRETKASAKTERRVEIPSLLTVQQLADIIGVGGVEVVKQLMQNGVIAGLNQTVDFDTAAIIATDFGYEAIETSTPEPTVPELTMIEGQELQTRPPVVTVMGHIDQGNTKLLDAIRETNVVASEAGGITQHIGAHQADVGGKRITFLDTPGHEAFTAMRARGARVTDIAVLVVAADDGVMPQTREAIAHAKAAGVPIVVALNKIDKPDVNLDRVKQQLGEEGLIIEEWGGDVICVPVSAKARQGIPDLLENILIVAEVQELKAAPDLPASGVVIEAGMDKTRGALATLLVQNGTLKPGDSIVVADGWGKVKAMFNDAGKRVKKAEPATPVKILGLSSVPLAGDVFMVVGNDREARALAQKRQQEKQLKSLRPTKTMSLDSLVSEIHKGGIKELNLVLKTGVQGSIDPINESIGRLQTDEVKVNVIHSGSGEVAESDVLLAVASKGVVVGFDTAPTLGARRLAELEGVDIRCYNVIYDLLEDIERAIKGLKEPKYAEVVDGHAEVRAVFSAGKLGKAAGLYVTDGKIKREDQVRVTRKGELLHQSGLVSLRRFKDDVKEVATGYECGMVVQGFGQFEEGDLIEAFHMEREDESAR